MVDLLLSWEAEFKRLGGCVERGIGMDLSLVGVYGVERLEIFARGGSSFCFIQSA